LKKFAFRLRRLLDVKNQQKRALAAAMARLQKQIVDVDRQIERANDEWLSWRARLMRQDAALAHERLELAAYMESLDWRLVSLHTHREKLKSDLDRSRRGFEIVTRGVKTLENLRARKFQEYMLEYDRAAQNESDELAMQKQWRQSDTTGAPESTREYQSH
jgi:flagellar export protein FliJ